jgi:hypothetical protein
VWNFDHPRLSHPENQESIALINSLSPRLRALRKLTRGLDANFNGAVYEPSGVARPCGITLALRRGKSVDCTGYWRQRGRDLITKTERPRSANLLQMPRGLMCKRRRCGRGSGGPAGSRGIDPPLQLASEGANTMFVVGPPSADPTKFGFSWRPAAFCRRALDNGSRHRLSPWLQRLRRAGQMSCGVCANAASPSREVEAKAGSRWL